MHEDLPNFGIYQAVVTDNSKFFKTGKIKVRISAFYNTAISWNLVDGYNEDEFNKMLEEDVNALLYSPFGGGYNHGFFALPQVNSKGLVQFLNGNIYKPIWMGALMRPEYQDDKFYRINIPNDDPTKDKGPSSDAITSDGNNLSSDEETIIFRQKSTKNPDGNSENMDFDKQDSENMIVMNKNKMEIYHFTEWDDNKGSTQFHKIELTDEGSQPEIRIKVWNYEDAENPKSIGVRLNIDEAVMEYMDSKAKKLNSVEVNKDGATLESNDLNTNESTTVSLEPTELLLTNKNNTVIVEQDDIALSATGRIRLSGSEVVLGAGGSYVVTSNSPNPIRMEDGSVLSKSTTVKA